MSSLTHFSPAIQVQTGVAMRRTIAVQCVWDCMNDQTGQLLVTSPVCHSAMSPQCANWTGHNTNKLTPIAEIRTKSMAQLQMWAGVSEWATWTHLALERCETAVAAKIYTNDNSSHMMILTQLQYCKRWAPVASSPTLWAMFDVRRFGQVFNGWSAYCCYVPPRYQGYDDKSCWLIFIIELRKMSHERWDTSCCHHFTGTNWSSIGNIKQAGYCEHTMTTLIVSA